MTNAVKTFTIKGLWDVCSPYRLTDFQETITATVFWEQLHQNDCHAEVDEDDYANIVFDDTDIYPIFLGRLRKKVNYVVQDVQTGGYINEYSLYRDEKGRNKLVIYTGVADGFRTYSEQSIEKRFKAIQKMAENLGIHREFRVVEGNIKDIPLGDRIVLTVH